jgi:O-antigen ligase
MGAFGRPFSFLPVWRAPLRIHNMASLPTRSDLSARFTLFAPLRHLSLAHLAFLPLLAALVWPRAHGPSLLVTPFLMGLAAVAWAGLWLRPRAASLPAAGWLALVLGVMGLVSPWTQTLWMQATVAAALAAWIALAIGREALARPEILRALVVTVTVAMLVNVFVAWLQFFDLEIHLYPWVSQNGSARPYGNLRQPNHLATLCVVALACIWWASQHGQWRRRSTVALALAALSGLALSVSRAGWLELVLVCLFMAWWSDGDKRFNRWLFGLAPLWTLLWSMALKALALGMTAKTTALTERGVASVNARFVHWQSAWDMALRHPVQGVGWGEFRYTRFLEEPIVTGAEIADNAHNLVLHLLAETGFAGTFLVLAPVLWLLATRRPWRPGAPVTERWGWLVILAIGAQSMLEFPLWYLNFLTPTALAFGVLLSPPGQPSPAGLQGLRDRAVAVLSAGLMGVSLLAAYDFVFRIMPAYQEDGRSNGDPAATATARKTWFFGYYADRILAAHVQVTKANAQDMWALSLRQMHAGPEPLNLWSGLAAQCQMGGGVYARELAMRFETAFPKPFQEFKSLTPPAQFKACVQ